MITYLLRDDLYVPMIVCDACAQPIDTTGNAYWVVYDSGQIDPRVWHTHKFRCSAIDRLIEQRTGGSVLSEELELWLVQLRNSFIGVDTAACPASAPAGPPRLTVVREAS